MAAPTKVLTSFLKFQSAVARVKKTGFRQIVFYSTTESKGGSKPPAQGQKELSKQTKDQQVKTSQSASSQQMEAPQSDTPNNDNSSYKVKEYYGYNSWSFYDIDNAMHAQRIPQPIPQK